MRNSIKHPLLFRKYGQLSAFFLAILTFASVTSAAPAPDKTPYSLCKLAQEVRTLRIVGVDEGKCQTIYNKYGKDQSVGEAQYRASCENILGRVQSTLESAGWKCRSVQNSGVSDLTTGVQ